MAFSRQLEAKHAPELAMTIENVIKLGDDASTEHLLSLPTKPEYKNQAEKENMLPICQPSFSELAKYCVINNVMIDKKDMQEADESDETSPRDYIKRFEVAAQIATSQPP